MVWIEDPQPIFDRKRHQLVYTTRNATGKKIMQGIIEKAKRKGTMRLERFF